MTAQDAQSSGLCVRAFPKQSSLWTNLIVATFFAALCLWGMWLAATTPVFKGPDEWGVRIFAMLMCANPAFWMLVLLKRIVPRINAKTPDLLIDDDGIMFWMWSRKTIAWENIARADEQAIGGGKFVSLWLHDIAASPPKSRWTAFRARQRVRLGMGDVLIASNSTTASHAEIITAVFERRGPVAIPERI